MAQQSNEAPRRGAAIAAAAAGLTLAAGVTVGALIGWVRPPTSPAPTTIEAAPAAAASEPEPAAIPEPSRAVDLAAEPTFEPEPDVVALERPRRRHDDHERREHRSREGHGDDD